MNILHISDTHIGSEKYFQERLFLEKTEEINNSDCDLVIHAGDLTHNGMRSEYVKARTLIRSIRKPLIILAGNHDARSGGLALFRDYIGPVDGYRELDDAIVVYVCSAVADSNAGRVGRVKFDLLRNTLYRFGSKKLKILVLHHHILPVPKSGRERNVLSNAGDLLDLIIKSDIDLVLLGHRHYPNIFNVEDTLFVNAGTLSSSKTRYGDVNSWNSIDIDDKEKHVSIERFDGTVIRETYPRRQRRIISDYGRRMLRIVQVANTFISRHKRFLPHHFENALYTINGLEPDVVLHCGGIVGEGIQRDYEYAGSLIKRLAAPCFFSPSGRDMNYLGYHLYSDFFGDIDPEFSEANVYIRGLAAFQYDSPVGMVGETARARLLEKLKTVDEERKIVFLHHNLVPVPRSRNKALLEDSGDVLRDFIDAGIDLVLTGTSSHPAAVCVGDTILANANSMSSLYQRSPFGNSFNLIDIYEGCIAVNEVNSLWGKRRLLGLWEL